MKWFDRDDFIGELEKDVEWDVLIIGGGATGLGLAVDAASRGYKTLLAEQEDFAKGTSGRSTKLVHGGVRYLAQGNISLVREALKERGLLLKNAPHITKNESFIIPCYSWMRGIFYTIGLKLYDWLAGNLSLGKSELLTGKNVLSKLPSLKCRSLKCGVLYHDGAFDDARLAINLAQTAAEKGAVVINYCRVISLHKNVRNLLDGALILDQESGRKFEVKAKIIINATGVFADEILAMDNPDAKSIIRPSQGVHLVVEKHFLPGEDALMIPRTADGRVLFAIPWHGKVLIGTTDTPLNSHSLEPRALNSEIDFILQTAGAYLNRQPLRSDVLSVFAGLRPLAATNDANEKTKEISRSHKIIFSESGLVSVIGGKWTTYRHMAEDTLDRVIKRKMLPSGNCITTNLKIHGYSATVSDNNFSFYGSDEKFVRDLMKENNEWSDPLIAGADINKAQVVWSVRNEMARTVEDVLARRTRILFYDARTAIALAAKVAEIMMVELKQNEGWKDNQVSKFIALARGYLVE